MARMAIQHSGFRLSKSKIASYQHCPKRLWLQVHRRELAEVDPATEKLLRAGHFVGEIARSRVPGGILIAADHRAIDAALTETRRLLNSPVLKPIFEAALQRDGVLIRADILEPDGWGGWRLIEVKNSGKVRPYQVRDVATQHWVATGAGLSIPSVVIRHVKRPLRDVDMRVHRTAFVDADVTSEAVRLAKLLPQIVVKARRVVAGPEPQPPAGMHCVRPFRCEFLNYCSNRAVRRGDLHCRHL